MLMLASHRIRLSGDPESESGRLALPALPLIHQPGDQAGVKAKQGETDCHRPPGPTGGLADREQ